MAFERPTLEEIVDRIKGDFKSLLGLPTILRRGLLDVTSKVVGAASHTLHGHIQDNKKQLFADSADEEFLLRIGTIYGLPQNEATFAQLNIDITGTTGGTVDINTIYQRSDGAQYKLNAEVVAPNAGTAPGVITSVDPNSDGFDGNIDDGSTVSLLSPIAGVASEAIVTSTAVEADDQELIEDYRVRLLERIRNPPSGGTVNDYIAFAKTVSGVTRVFVLPSHLGEGTVGLTFVEDNEDPIIPSVAKVLEVQIAVAELKPISADLFVFAPAETTLDLQIALKPNTTVVQNAVNAEIDDLLLRDAQVRDAIDPELVGLDVRFDGKILLSRINEAISIAAGEVDHVLINPTADVQPEIGGIVTKGTTVFSILP